MKSSAVELGHRGSLDDTERVLGPGERWACDPELFSWVLERVFVTWNQPKRLIAEGFSSLLTLSNLGLMNLQECAKPALSCCQSGSTWESEGETNTNTHSRPQQATFFHSIIDLFHCESNLPGWQ